MPDNTTLFDNPIVMMVTAGLIIGLVGGVLGRFINVIGRLTPAALFLSSFYLAYGAVPSFPPIASTGKIFYSVVGLVVLGLIFDYVVRKRAVAVICAAIVPGLLVIWIGYVRLTGAFSLELATVAAVFVVVGAFAFVWTQAVDAGPISASRGPVASISILLALAVGYAPIALVGGSSTGLGLLAGFAAGLGGLGLIQLIFKSAPLGWTGILSGLGGFLAVNDSVTLINGKMDFFLLALLCLSLVSGRLVALLLPQMEAKSLRLCQIVAGMSTLIPALVVIGLAFLHHAEAFHP